MQDELGEGVKHAGVCAAVDDGSVVVEAEHHPRKEGKDDVAETNTTAGVSGEILEGPGGERGPGGMEGGTVAETLPDEDVVVRGKGWMTVGRVEVEGEVEVEEVAEVVVHVDRRVDLHDVGGPVNKNVAIGIVGVNRNGGFGDVLKFGSPIL
jgi:hypothetical protein